MFNLFISISESGQKMKTLTAVLIFSFIPFLSFADPIDNIIIEPETSGETYDRMYYKHWVDADGDGEKTRREVLNEETLKGFWVGPYTGLVTSNPTDLDVDHMVPLKEAHVSGGFNWREEKRRRYANDLSNPNHLIAVAKGSNRSKGRKDPAKWMPPNRSYWCEYLNNWVEVKVIWGLSMDQAEYDAIVEGLKICGKYKNGDSFEGRH